MPTDRSKPMPALLAGLQADHRHFSRLLAILERELEGIRRGEAADWKLLADAFEYFEAYPDLVHHPREDIVYRYCLDRCETPPAELEGLEEEHAAIAETTTALRQALEGVLSDGVVDRQALLQGIESYLAMQKTHMEHEERTVFPLLLATLSEEAWEALEKTVAVDAPPLLDSASGEAYDALYQRIVSRR